MSLDHYEHSDINQTMVLPSIIAANSGLFPRIAEDYLRFRLTTQAYFDAL
jgi:hypothetical protein